MVGAMPGLFVLLALTIHAAAQVLPANAAPPGPRTGMIVGQVVDAGTGAPVPEAMVQLTMPQYFQSPAAPNDRVMADREGRFVFAELPRGDYFLHATKDGYAPGTYGQRQVSGQGHDLSLGEGERRADVTLRVWKYAVIGGTVVDEAGEPVVGISVRALLRNVVGGRTGYGNAPWLVPATTTDDRGMFRLSQLTPATYVVVAPSTHTTMPAAAVEAPDTALRSDLFFSGVPQVTLLGDPRTQQFGDVALMTLNAVLVPPPASPAGRMHVYRTTYYPAATTAAAATPISLEAGQERTDLTIALRPVPAVRISGRLVAPDGSAPPPTTIRLVGDSMTDVIVESRPNGPADIGFETVTGMSDTTGRFTLLGVPAGEYVLQHGTSFVSRAAQQGRPSYWMSQRITVGTDDISDLTVALRPALRVEGRIEFRGTAPVPATGVTFETPFGEPGQFSVPMKNDATLTFSTVAAGGRYIARPYERFGWFVQSVTMGGKDITDRAFDLQADTTSLIVTYADRPSKVSGTVTDARGNASPTAVVLVFPVDPRRWSGYGTSPRILKSALTTRTGVYTFAHVPPGDYYLVAIDPEQMDGWKDPARLEALAADASRLTVAAGDASKTLDLRLKGTR
jgi:hypothetical protein